MDTSAQNTPSSSELEFIDLRPYFWAAWNLKIRGALIVIATTLIGFSASYTQPKMYKAEIVLAYSAERTMQSDTSLTSRLGGLSSIGSSIGLFGSKTGKLEEDLATLRSNQFTQRFIEAESLQNQLIAGQWNILNQKMEFNPKLFDESTQKLTKKGRIRLNRNLHLKKFQKLVEIADDKRSSLVSISLLWSDRSASKKLLTNYVNSLNNFLRDSEIADAKSNINYLVMQIKQTEVIELKNTFFSLIEAQHKKIMLAQTRPDYAFRIIDPPLKPYVTSAPLRIIFAAGGLAFGLAIFLAAVVRTTNRGTT